MATGNATLISNIPNSLSKSQISSSSSSSSQTLNLGTRTPWLGATTSLSLQLQSSTLRPPPRKAPIFAATVSLSDPAINPLTGSSSSDKLPRWSFRAMKSFSMGELEARKLKLPATGTEGILLGILYEGTSLASKFLRANGITLLKARQEAVKLLGKPNLYFFTPEYPPLTESARRAIDWAIEKKIKSGESGEIPTSYLLLGVWSEADSPGHKIMENFGFTDEKAKELESLCAQPGFDDD